MVRISLSISREISIVNIQIPDVRQKLGKNGKINSEIVRNMRRNGHETSRISIIYVTESNGQGGRITMIFLVTVTVTN